MPVGACASNTLRLARGPQQRPAADCGGGDGRETPRSGTSLPSGGRASGWAELVLVCPLPRGRRVRSVRPSPTGGVLCPSVRRTEKRTRATSGAGLLSKVLCGLGRCLHRCRGLRRPRTGSGKPRCRARLPFKASGALERRRYRSIKARAGATPAGRRAVSGSEQPTAHAAHKKTRREGGLRSTAAENLPNSSLATPIRQGHPLNLSI